MVLGKSVKEMIEIANAAVPRIAPADAQALMGSGEALIIDVRDPTEVKESGKVAGAINISRGMLEFRADPGTQYYDKRLKAKTLILYCASGGRSALGGKVLKDMGYDAVFNLGAFKDWVAYGGATEKSADATPVK